VDYGIGRGCSRVRAIAMRLVSVVCSVCEVVNVVCDRNGQVDVRGEMTITSEAWTLGRLGEASTNRPRD